MSQEQLRLFDPDKIKRRYPTVSTAEKRRLLEEAGEPWPVCNCCGIEKVWSSRNNIASGGEWRLRCTFRKKDAKSKFITYYTPTTYRYNWMMQRIDDRMQKYIEGTKENKEYLERIYQSWQMKLNAQS